MAKVIDGMKALNQIKRKVNTELDLALRREAKPKSTIRALLLKDFNSEPVREDKSSLVFRCSRLDPKAREMILDIIFQLLLRFELSQGTVNAVLSQYYINYFSSPSDITSSKVSIGLSKVRKILITRDADYDDKLKKVAQVIYQDFYGLSVMDEFMYMGVDSDGTKIEEVSSFGPSAFWFKTSGIDVKLDKLSIDENLLRNIVSRLSSNSPDLLLNKANPSISTDSLMKDRVTLTCPDYTRYYEFNIRRHYPNLVTRDMMINNGSTTVGFERWLDHVMEFYPRVVLTGDQASGKTTRLRMIAERYKPGTVIGTIESSYELELSDIPHLIVKQLKSNVIDLDTILESTLRYGLHVIVNGETRSGAEVGLTIQAGQRSSRGTITSSHAPTAGDMIRTYKQLLVGAGVFTTEQDAMFAITQSLDIVIATAIDNNGDSASGFRYIDAVYAMPKIKESEIDSFEPFVIFKCNPRTLKLEFVNNLPDSLLDFFSTRVYKPEILEKLKSGDFSD